MSYGFAALEKVRGKEVYAILSISQFPHPIKLKGSRFYLLSYFGITMIGDNSSGFRLNNPNASIIYQIPNIQPDSAGIIGMRYMMVSSIIGMC